MSLAQVQLIVSTIAELVASWAALLVAVALMLPEQTGRAETALRTKSKHCLGIGLLMMGLFVVGLIVLNLPPVRIFGLLLCLSVGGIMAVGAAGLSKLMGSRIAELSGQTGNSFGNFFKGCLAYSLAGLFPFLGWLLFLPISTCYALGAGTLAVWPKRKTVPTTPQMPGQPQFDVSGVA